MLSLNLDLRDAGRAKRRNDSSASMNPSQPRISAPLNTYRCAFSSVAQQVCDSGVRNIREIVDPLSPRTRKILISKALAFPTELVAK